MGALRARSGSSTWPPPGPGTTWWSASTATGGRRAVPPPASGPPAPSTPGPPPLARARPRGGRPAAAAEPAVPPSPVPRRGRRRRTGPPGWPVAGERLARAEQPSTLAATAVARLARTAGPASHGARRGRGRRARPGADDLEDEQPVAGRPAWRRGRAGTAVGRAVHATLQLADLETGSRGWTTWPGPRRRPKGCRDRATEVVALARAAVESEVVRRAVAGGRYWRELYVGAPLGGRVLEGIIDLLVEGPDGLEVVDYKTDQLGTAEEVDRALARYRVQGAAYAVALEEALGRPVDRCTFLFLRPGRRRGPPRWATWRRPRTRCAASWQGPDLGRRPGERPRAGAGARARRPPGAPGAAPRLIESSQWPQDHPGCLSAHFQLGGALLCYETVAEPPLAVTGPTRPGGGRAAGRQPRKRERGGVT